MMNEDLELKEPAEGLEEEWVEEKSRWAVDKQLPLADELLPPVIRELVSIAPSNRKVESMIACLAPLGMLSSRVRFWVDEVTLKRDAILLQVLIEGEPSMGKGFVEDIERNIMHNIIDQRDERQRLAEQEYREKRLAANGTNENVGPAPSGIVLQIPPATSKNSIVKRAGMYQRRLGVPLTMWLFASELAQMVDANKSGVADLHTILRTAYDLNSKYGQDYSSDNSYSGIVNLMICSMFTTTPVDTDNFMTREAVAGGNCNRLIFCEIDDPPGSRPAKFLPLTTEQKTVIDLMVQKLYDNILTPEDNAQPEWVMDMTWLGREVDAWVEYSCNQAEEMFKAGDEEYRPYDSFRKRTSKNAERCTALFYYLYQLELGVEAANCEEIHERCRIIYRYMTHFCLNNQMSRWGKEYLEYYKKRQLGAKIGKQLSLYNQMTKQFTRQELIEQIAKNGLKTDARFFISQWKGNGWIHEVKKHLYVKIK